MKSWGLPLVLGLIILGLLAARSFVLKPQMVTEADLNAAVQQQVFRGAKEGLEHVGQLLEQRQRIRQARLQDTAFQVDVRVPAAEEWQAWWRQWELEEERQKRLSWQGLSSKEWESEIAESLKDQAWLEQQIVESCRVDETELREEFERQKLVWRLPLRQHVAHLFLAQKEVSREPEIRDLKRRLEAGENWAVLVQAHSEDSRTKTRAGDLGWVSQERMPADFMKTVLKLKPGETSAVVQTKLGWHLIRLLERQAERAMTFDEARPELHAMLLFQKRRAALERLLETKMSGSSRPGH